MVSEYDETYKSDFYDGDGGTNGPLSAGKDGDGIASNFKKKLETGMLNAEAVMCPDCHFIKDIESEDTREWLRANRPDLFRLIEGGAKPDDPIACKCEQIASKEASKEARIIALAVDNEAQRIREANLPRRNDHVGTRTFVNFDSRTNVFEMVAAVKAWGDGEGPGMLTVVSVPGAGKSHLAEAAIKKMLDDGKRVRYEKAEPLLNIFRRAFSGREEKDIEQVFDWLFDFEALVIDDLGANRATDWGVGYMTLIIDHFYSEGKRLLICTNVTDENLLAASWDERIADRVFDENSGAVRVVWSEATSYRTTKVKA